MVSQEVKRRSEQPTPTVIPRAACAFLSGSNWGEEKEREALGEKLQAGAVGVSGMPLPTSFVSRTGARWLLTNRRFFAMPAIATGHCGGTRIKLPAPGRLG